MNWPSDLWTGIFLGLFAFGLIFTVISFFLGGGDDLPDLSADGDVSDAGGLEGPSWFSLSTVMIFITWFGASGYIARQWGGLAVPLALALSSLVGVLGAALVYFFLAKVLWRGQTHMDPGDYVLEGTVANVTSSIRAGGVGEIVYTIAGSRRVDGARSVDGAAIPTGSEVEIRRYEGGLAYVAPLNGAEGDEVFPGDLITVEEGVPTQPGRPGNNYVAERPGAGRERTV